jgi:hypothetical protein
MRENKKFIQEFDTETSWKVIILWNEKEQILEKLVVAQPVKKIPRFMEPEVSLPCSQEPNESSPRSPAMFRKRREHTIKMDLEEMCRGDVNWIAVVKYHGLWLVLVLVMMKLGVLLQEELLVNIPIGRKFLCARLLNFSRACLLDSWFIS